MQGKEKLQLEMSYHAEATEEEKGKH